MEKIKETSLDSTPADRIVLHQFASQPHAINPMPGSNVTRHGKTEPTQRACLSKILRIHDTGPPMGFCVLIILYINNIICFLCSPEFLGGSKPPKYYDSQGAKQIRSSPITSNHHQSPTNHLENTWPITFQSPLKHHLEYTGMIHKLWETGCFLYSLMMQLFAKLAVCV